MKYNTIKNTNKWVAKTLSLSLCLNSFMGLQNQAHAAYIQSVRDIINSHSCEVENKKTGLKLKATCGTVNGNPYAVFVDPNTDQVIEQIFDPATQKTAPYFTTKLILRKNCTVQKKGSKEEIEATCGYKPDSDGVLTEFIFFQDQGLDVEQFIYPDLVKTSKYNPAYEYPQNDTNATSGDSTNTFNTSGASSNAEANHTSAAPVKTAGDSKTDETTAESLKTKALIVGGAAIATVATIFGIGSFLKPKPVKAKKSSRTIPTSVSDAMTTDYYAKPKAPKTSKTEKSLPKGQPNTKVEIAKTSAPTKSIYNANEKTITLGSEVPGIAGQTINITSSIPSTYINTNRIPIFTANNQRFVVLRNPQTKKYEAALLFDNKTRANYDGYDYGTYHSFMDPYSPYSPYYFTGPNNRNIFFDETPNTSYARPALEQRHANSEVVPEAPHRNVVSDVTTTPSEAEYSRVSHRESSKPSEDYTTTQREESTWKSHDSEPAYTSTNRDDTYSSPSSDWSSSSSSDSSGGGGGGMD